jgi:putative hydrolase of the HAD superfamily
MSYTHLFLDLDGTLYPNNNGMWEAIAVRMERYMYEVIGIPQAEIPETRQRYFLQYGTTLRGLMRNHSIDPQRFLAYVHDIPVGDYLKPDQALRETLQSVQQPKWILTNSDTPHATRVLNALGLYDLFDGILDITIMEFENKPSPGVFHKALKLAGGAEASTSVFVDDIPHNLAQAKQLGWITVLVGNKPVNGSADYQIDSIYRLNDVLEQIKHG